MNNVSVMTWNYTAGKVGFSQNVSFGEVMTGINFDPSNEVYFTGYSNNKVQFYTLQGSIDTGPTTNTTSNNTNNTTSTTNTTNPAVNTTTNNTVSNSSIISNTTVINQTNVSDVSFTGVNATEEIN